MTSIAIRRSLHPKYLCETVRYARSVLTGPPCSPARSNRLPGEISVVEPPDPIPNSEVKRNSADGSVGFPCESRSSPGFYPGSPQHTLGASSLCASVKHRSAPTGHRHAPACTGRVIAPSHRTCRAGRRVRTRRARARQSSEPKACARVAGRTGVRQRARVIRAA